MKYFWLLIGIANAGCIAVNIANQKWDILAINIVACVLCFSNFMISG